VEVLSAHQKKSFHTIRVLQRTVERRNSFRQAKSVPSSTLLRRASGLCGIKPIAGQAAGLSASFCNFFFQKKKKLDVPFSKGFFAKIFSTNKKFILPP
jgi:hypothetical protein